MWLIVRAVVVVPGVRVLGATFDDGKELASKSGSSGSVVVEGTGLRLLKLTISGTDCSPLDHSLAEMVDCQSWGPASPCWQWCSSCSAEGRGWKQPKPRRQGNGGVVASSAVTLTITFQIYSLCTSPFPLSLDDNDQATMATDPADDDRIYRFETMLRWNPRGIGTTVAFLHQGNKYDR